VGAGAGFHRHHAPRLTGEESQQLVPPELLAEDHGAERIRPVRLKNRLRQSLVDKQQAP
jgi:hypothetical protein